MPGKIPQGLVQAFKSKAGAALAEAKNLGSVEEFVGYLESKGKVLRESLREALSEGQGLLSKEKPKLEQLRKEVVSNTYKPKRDVLMPDEATLDPTKSLETDPNSVFNKLKQFLEKDPAEAKTVSSKLTAEDVNAMLEESATIPARFGEERLEAKKAQDILKRLKAKRRE